MIGAVRSWWGDAVFVSEEGGVWVIESFRFQLERYNHGVGVFFSSIKGKSWCWGLLILYRSSGMVVDSSYLL